MADAKWTPAHSIKVIAKHAGDGWTDVKTLIRHPMDSGFLFTRDFVPIPAHYIQTLSFKHNGRIVFQCDWGPAISTNPFLEFRFKGAKAGDKLEIHWVDNEGMSDSATAAIA